MRDDPRYRKSLIELLDETFSQSLDDVSDMLTAKIELAKLEAIELLAGVAANIVLVLISLMGALCLLIALALYLGEWFGQRSLGFLVTGVGLIGAVLFITVAQPLWVRNWFLTLLWHEYQRRQLTKQEQGKKSCRS